MLEPGREVIAEAGQKSPGNEFAQGCREERLRLSKAFGAGEGQVQRIEREEETPKENHASDPVRDRRQCRKRKAKLG